MMEPRPVAELDLLFYGGNKIVADFTSDITAGTKADVAYLKCPTGPVTRATTLNIKEGRRDFVILRTDIFIEPCDIDGEDTTLMLRRQQPNKNIWVLEIQTDDTIKWRGAGKSHIIREAENIVNEFGHVVVNLKEDARQERNLLDEYVAVTVKDLVNQKESGEIKEQMLQCLQNKDTISQDVELVNLCQTE